MTRWRVNGGATYRLTSWKATAILRRAAREAGEQVQAEWDRRHASGHTLRWAKLVDRVRAERAAERQDAADERRRLAERIASLEAELARMSAAAEAEAAQAAAEADDRRPWWRRLFR